MNFHFILIDDESIFNFLTEKKIEASGIKGKIDSYNSAMEVVDKFRNFYKPEKDTMYVIFLDVRMPIMDGFQFLDELFNFDHELTDKINVFMLTSSIDDKDFKKAMSYPFVKGYFSKPLDSNAIYNMTKVCSVTDTN